MRTMQYFTLNHKISFYVPSTSKVKAKISNNELTERTRDIAELLTSYFGGASVEKIQGFYKAQNGQYITETIQRVFAFTSDLDLEKYGEDIMNLAKNKCLEWEQESIGLEIDNKFLLID